MAKAARAGTDSGSTTLREHLEVRGAVDAGRLEEVAGQLADEVVEQEDGQRQAEGRVRQPDAQERLADAQPPSRAPGPG